MGQQAGALVAKESHSFSQNRDRGSQGPVRPMNLEKESWEDRKEGGGPGGGRTAG